LGKVFKEVHDGAMGSLKSGAEHELYRAQGRINALDVIENKIKTIEGHMPKMLL